MVKDRKTLVLYSTAVCNLKCTYCFIDKNPALQKIDQLLDESYKGDYYFNFAKQVFPDPNQLEEIQIWGGEPTLNFHRIIPTIHKLLDYYPNLNQFMFSTNLAHEHAVDEILYFIKALSNDRTIHLNIQLSLDGPKYINDANRGQGTTEKFTKNFAKLVSNINSVFTEAPNVLVNAFTKSTLDVASINALQTKEKIIEYYKFLELFYDLSLTTPSSNFAFRPHVPNTACPLPTTVELGKKFANFCKLCTEIEEENITKHIFKVYTDITPYKHTICQDSTICNRGSCGGGRLTLGLLPDNLISTCHNGFTELLAEYKKYALENANSSLQDGFFKNFTNPTVFPFSDLAEKEKYIENYFNRADNNMMLTLIGQIQFLAAANQIDKKYLDLNNAKAAAVFIRNRTAFCVRDNINITGVHSIPPVNLQKLLLNGAKEFIENTKAVDILQGKIKEE